MTVTLLFFLVEAVLRCEVDHLTLVNLPPYPHSPLLQVPDPQTYPIGSLGESRWVRMGVAYDADLGLISTPLILLNYPSLLKNGRAEDPPLFGALSDTP